MVDGAEKARWNFWSNPPAVRTVPRLPSFSTGSKSGRPCRTSDKITVDEIRQCRRDRQGCGKDEEAVHSESDNQHRNVRIEERGDAGDLGRGGGGERRAAKIHKDLQIRRVDRICGCQYTA